MIDLISDTITLPSAEMLACISHAELGDAGRIDAQGRGEDKTTNALEDMAAGLTGFEAAMFCPTGTIGNTSAILSYAQRGDTVLVEARQHLYENEKICFEYNGFGLKPIFYHIQQDGSLDPSEFETLLSQNDVKLVCLENTHNFSGGKAIPLASMKAIRAVCSAKRVPIHLDGARLFNAAEALSCKPADICRYVDSVMFCTSKGLGAPIGSLLCSSKERILKAMDWRKYLGGTMRQSGIAAACSIYALQHNAERLKEDRENTQYLAKELKKLKKLQADPSPHSNILLLDLKRAGIKQAQLCSMLLEKGVRGMAVSETEVRLVFHLGITREDAEKAAAVLLEIDAAL